MNDYAIPAVVATELYSRAWCTDKYSRGKFKEMLKFDEIADAKQGSTSMYIVRRDENDFLAKMADAELIPSEMYFIEKGNICINQHWLHSLQQFFAVCQNEWDDHQHRTSQLIGTPQGTITK